MPAVRCPKLARLGRTGRIEIPGFERYLTGRAEPVQPLPESLPSSEKHLAPHRPGVGHPCACRQGDFRNLSAAPVQDGNGPPGRLGDDEVVFGRGFVGLMPEHDVAASCRSEVDLISGSLRDDLKLAIVPYGDVHGRIPGLPVVVPAHFRDAVTERDPAVRMNAYRIRTEIVPELRVNNAS